MTNSFDQEIDDLDESVFYADGLCCDESEFLDDIEFDEETKPCPGCFGTGLDRELDSDCLTCWGDGVV